jgi:hypothetical protein
MEIGFRRTFDIPRGPKISSPHGRRPPASRCIHPAGCQRARTNPHKYFVAVGSGTSRACSACATWAKLQPMGNPPRPMRGSKMPMPGQRITAAESLHGRTDARTHAHTHARTHARTHGRTDARTHGRTDARTHARTHGHADARTHGRTDARTHARTHGRTDARTH